MIDYRLTNIVSFATFVLSVVVLVSLSLSLFPTSFPSPYSDVHFLRTKLIPYNDRTVVFKFGKFHLTLSSKNDRFPGMHLLLCFPAGPGPVGGSRLPLTVLWL